jgi:hypothetical protein
LSRVKKRIKLDNRKKAAQLLREKRHLEKEERLVVSDTTLVTFISFQPITKGINKKETDRWVGIDL